MMAAIDNNNDAIGTRLAFQDHIENEEVFEKSLAVESAGVKGQTSNGVTVIQSPPNGTWRHM